MKKYVLLLAACCMALPVAALDPLGAYNTRPPEGCIDKDVTQEELGLEDLIQVSICTNPSLSAQYMGVKASEAAVGASRSQYLPSVTLTGTGNITGERLEHQDYVQGEPYQGKAEASWLLFDFGGRGARIDATIRALQQMGLETLGLSHCSGDAAECALQAFPDVTGCHLCVGDTIFYD